MQTRKASIKETGEELSQADWARFDAAVAAAKIERRAGGARVVERPRRGGAVQPAERYEEGAPSRP